MRKSLIWMTAVVLVLAVLLAACLKPGVTGWEDDAEIIAPGTYEEKERVDIHIRSAKANRRTDGGYEVEVLFSTDIAQSLEEMRMVTVFCGEQISGFALTEENLEDIHKTVFWVAVQPETVRVEVRAHQTETGLLLISDGEGQLCGCAEAPVDGDRILQLSGAKPGAAYRVYRIADLSELLSGLVKLNSRPTVKEREAYAVAENYVMTLMAEADGTAFCNFTGKGMPDGIYLAVGEGEAFYICLPIVEASGEFRSSVARLSLGNE